MKLNRGRSIHALQSGRIVTLNVEVRVDGKPWTLHFGYEAAGEFDAQLLRSALEDAIDSKIEAVRKHEYENGYKDGRGKRARRGWTPCTLHIPGE